MIINIESSTYLSEIETSKTYRGIKQIGEKERQREKGLEREKQRWWRGKGCGLF
jgi:hypothetical protein